MPSQLYSNDAISFVAAKPFLYRGEQYELGEEFPQEDVNNLETLVRARYVIPVVDDPLKRPRHWHQHLRTRDEAQEYLTRSRSQLKMPHELDSDEVVNLPLLTDPNREEPLADPNPLPGPPPGWEKEAAAQAEEEAADDTEESDEPYYAQRDVDPEPEPESRPAVLQSEVQHGSIATVKNWVGDDVDRAEAALETEKNGQQRSTLISWLEAKIGEAS